MAIRLQHSGVESAFRKLTQVSRRRDCCCAQSVIKAPQTIFEGILNQYSYDKELLMTCLTTTTGRVSNGKVLIRRQVYTPTDKPQPTNVTSCYRPVAPSHF
ncbi:hypothetical protein [Hymenobacter qilianensis]|uniref:Uncharacterized protein n=1 Tax=Hymenobacter qilianensis TaxID=1385715 RepID=A0A7H0H0Z4_9BACT|nr:hypothetical protein [Hymenobacter qilianensis]QNP54210.1 hypothetical protein H9L05_04670 [Hymenobacter qilianensis]